MNLREFISKENLRNQWIYEKFLHAYVRRSQRLLNGKMDFCLDIASVEVDEKHRGKGIFVKFLTKAEQEAKKMNRKVFVESILNEKLLNFLLNRGYVMCENSNPPSVFK